MADLTPVEDDVKALLRLATAKGTSTSEFKGAVAVTVGAALVALLAWLDPSGKISGWDQVIVSTGSTVITGGLWSVYVWARSKIKQTALAHPAVAAAVTSAIPAANTPAA